MHTEGHLEGRMQILYRGFPGGLWGQPGSAPELAVVALVRPPEGVLLEELVLLEVGAHAPALVVRERVPVLAEQRVDARDAPVPAVLQVLIRATQGKAGSGPAVTCGGHKHWVPTNLLSR